MAKINDTYPNLIGGVSQRPPETRETNQVSAQVNMLSDPVSGLTRRPGSLLRAVGALPGVTREHAATLGQHYREFDFRVGTQDLTLIAASAPVSPLPFCFALNKTTGAMLEVVLESNAAMTALVAGGVAAATALGRFLVLSGNTAAPAYTTTFNWAPRENQKRHVVWVRGGAYSRAFSLSLIRGNQKLTVQYETLSASYPNTLDTSDLLPTDPDYQKKVNDRTNAYNSAVTKWIGDALADASAVNIATKLASELNTSNFLAPGYSLEVSGSTIFIVDDSVEGIEADDGGDGSLIRAVSNEVSAPELLSTSHYSGKVVRVRPQSGLNGVTFYVKAVPKDGATGDFTEVSWEECAGTTFQPTQGLFFSTLGNDNRVYIASSPEAIGSLAGFPFAGYKPNVSGDMDTNPPPDWLVRGASALGLFQDRIIIGAGNAVNSSRSGDYLNFFRRSVVTVVADDPVNFTIIGGEEDTLRKTLIYDRNLVLFGDQQQYLIDGRRPFEPGTASAVVMSPVPNAAQVQPVFSENYMFYAKGNGQSTSLHRFRPGSIDENPVIEELSEDLDSYIMGTPVSMRLHDTPNIAFVRSTGTRYLSVYQFKDFLNGQNKQSAWHRWDFRLTAGQQDVILGVAPYNGYVYLLVVEGTSPCNTALLKLPLDPDEGKTLPYLDRINSTSGSYVALDRAAGYVGTASANAGLLPPGTKWYGELIEAGVSLTRPFVRDRNGGLYSDSDLTVSYVKPILSDVSGLTVQITFNSAPTFAARFEGKGDEVEVDPGTLLLPFAPAADNAVLELVRPASQNPATQVVTNIGTYPTAETTIHVAADARDYVLTLGPYLWGPLTITHVEWAGSFFPNTPRE